LYIDEDKDAQADLVHMGISDHHIFEFQKILTKISDIVNDVSHKRAKFQFQILYILSYTKMKKM
jgi:hypothetical protein